MVEHRGREGLRGHSRGPDLPWQPSPGLSYVVLLVQLIPRACACALIHTNNAQPSHCCVCEDYRTEVYALIGTLNLYIHITVDMNGVFNCLKTSAPHCDTSITPGTLLDPAVPLTCSPLPPVYAQNAT